MASPSDGLIASYVRWRSSLLGQTTDRLENELLFELVGPVAGRTILDVGCGDRALVAALARRGAAVTGVDADPAMLDAARRRGEADGVDMRLCRAEATRLPFDDGAFDSAMAITMLCFVDDAAPAVAEMARVVKPGGIVVIGELGPWSLWGAHRRLRGLLGDPTWRAATFRSASKLKKLIGEAGLVVFQARGAVHYPPYRAAARLLAPIDLWLGRRSTLAAAFVGMSAVKPTTHENGTA